MRRIIALGACFALTAVLLAGCGSSSSGSGSPVTTELSYFSAGSPLVLSIATDPNSAAVKNAEALIAKFPVAGLGESALMSKIQQLGIDYQSDVKPLFGNPIMLGATGSQLSSAGASSNFLFVWVTKDAGKLKSLIGKLGGAHSIGTHQGATLYQAGTTTLAIDGATALLGPSAAIVDSALDRHANGGGITESDYSRTVSGLPQDALIQVFGNLTTALSQPSAIKARRIPWVAALRGYAVSISANSSGLTFQYRLDTSGATLTPAQIPFAPSSSPLLAGTMPITVGIQDPAHIVQFAESAAQAVNPASYAKYLARQANARKKTGVDLNSLLGLLTGTLIVASDTHATMGRAEVSDPSTASSDLAKLASAPKDVFSKATGVKSIGGGFYEIRESGTTLTVGVVGNQLLVGKASATQLRSFASSPTTPAAGAQGSVAFRVALVDLLRLGLKNGPPQVAQSFLGSLGAITGWMSSTPSATSGSATLGVR